MAGPGRLQAHVTIDDIEEGADGYALLQRDLESDGTAPIFGGPFRCVTADPTRAGQRSFETIGAVDLAEQRADRTRKASALFRGGSINSAP
jgi:hypothetical protein